MGGIGVRLLGIPVRIEAAFLLAMGFLGWAMGRQGVYLAMWLLVAASSVLLHELGHALAFRRFGADPEVVLQGFGGYTTGSAQPPARSIAVSLAGPAVGLAIGGLVLVVARATSIESEFVATTMADLVFVNLGWGLFNLLPMLPLDGGNVMAAALAGLTKGGGQKSARVVSLVTAGALIVAALVLRQPFIAIMAAFLGSQNLTALGASRDEPQVRQLDHARRLVLAGENEAALGAAAEIGGQTRSMAVAADAAEVQAWALLAMGRPTDAEAVLARANGGVGASQLVRATVAATTPAGLPSAMPLATGFGASTDVAAAKVAAAVVVEAGLLDAVITGIAALPAASATQGYEVLRVGLEASGFHAEAARLQAEQQRRLPDTTQ